MPVSVAEGALHVDESLVAVVEEIAAGSGVDPAAFWAATADLISEFAPRNRVTHLSPCPAPPPLPVDSPGP